jgi:hypothetical protein
MKILNDEEEMENMKYLEDNIEPNEILAINTNSHKYIQRLRRLYRKDSPELKSRELNIKKYSDNSILVNHSIDIAYRQPKFKVSTMPNSIKEKQLKKRQASSREAIPTISMSFDKALTMKKPVKILSET